MASFHNVTNEKSSVFEDADYDPDLEARLYAEIYYSNENYQQDYITTDDNVQNFATNLTSANSVARAIGGDNFFVDRNSCPSQALDKPFDLRSVYPSKSWVFGAKNKNACSSLSRQFSGPPRAKQQRALAHKDLWLEKVQPETQKLWNRADLQNLDDLSLERRLFEAETFATAVRCSRENKSFSPLFGNKSVDDSTTVAVVDQSNETGRFSTQFGVGAIDCGNILIGENRSNSANNFSIELRNRATVNCCNETENTDRQFGSGAISANNFASYSNPNETRTNCLPLGSGSIEVENIRPVRHYYNEVRNCSASFGCDTIEDCNITPVVNHSEIHLPQCGRVNTAQNSRTIVTRSKKALKRRIRTADTAERFVAESLETDFNGEGLFNLSLANRIENFNHAHKRTPLLKIIEIARKLAKFDKKREAATRRRAERKRKRTEYLKNANLIMDGKYKVISKNNKLKMRESEPEPVDISSDSDDSILEVPVPPKAPPPVIQLQDSDDDLDADTGESRKSLSKKDRKTNLDESSTLCSDENDSSENDESSAVSTCENSPRICRKITKKSKKTENSVVASSNQQEREGDSRKSSKSRPKKGKKSAEVNRGDSVASLVSENDFSETSAEPIVETGLTISRETPKKTKTSESLLSNSSIQECEEGSGKSGKNRMRKGKKLVEENREVSTTCRISETDSLAEPLSESIADCRTTISRETPKKTKNVENSAVTPNNQELDDDPGKSIKNRSKRSKKSVEENREESADSRILETDFPAESTAELIAKSSSTISQRTPRDTPKKATNLEHSSITSSIQECEDESIKSSKNRLKKSKKSAEESREEPTTSLVAEADLSAEPSAEPIVDSNSAIPQRISRETPKKARNPEPSVATPNIQECEDDSVKASKNRLKKGKKSAEETIKESAASFVSETDLSAENSVERMADSSATGPHKISRDTPKKSKNVANFVATSNEQEFKDDSVKLSKTRTKKGKKSADESREETTASLNLESTSKGDETTAAAIREAKLQKILKDAAKKTRDTEHSTEISKLDDGNIILNCTEIQKGASSLEEIKKMREGSNLIHAHSDDSMTEGEANNWVNIAADQTIQPRKDAETCSISSSVDGSINPALWDQLAQENRAPATDSSIEIQSPSGQDFLSIQMNSKSTEGDFDAPVMIPEAANSRKRQKASSPFKDFDVPAIPEKKAKTRPKTSREQTLTEYFFKPMSKELQAFYNNPWGGENLTVCDVQSRMPRNPNCWAILDADLRGPTSKKRKLCPRCKSDTHFGKKCPEKAKPPCCYMCGAKGHTESRCPNKMCLTCGRKYAIYRPTCGYCSQLLCTICKGLGHSCENCPDLWRRYHNTTTATLPEIPTYASSIMKPVQNLSCCNCAKRGHDVTMCRQLRWSQHFLTPMYVTSYTAGPMYEPSNNAPIQQPLIYDLTNESPHQEQYFDADPQNSSTVEFSSEEFLEAANADRNIETIEIPDDSPSADPEISLAQAEVIFRAGQLDLEKTLGWHRSQTRLDTLKNIELTGILSGKIKPEFLLHWQAHFQFGVEIIHDIVAGTYITIVCVTTRIFCEFEKIIWQWLSRTDAEKAYLIYEPNPFEFSSKLVQVMNMKLGLTKNVMPVVKLLKKIAVTDKTLKETAANIKATQSKKNRRRISSIWSYHGISSVRRCQLITALYSGKYVEKGDIILQRFQCLARERLRRIQRGHNLPDREYFQFVHIYNEIFTFHRTEALTKALDKAIAHFRAENPSESQQLDQLNHFPEAEIQFPTDESNLNVVTSGEGQNNFMADSLAESLPLLANPAMNCVVNIDTQSANEPQEFNKDFSGDSQQVAAASSEILTDEPTPNAGASSGGVLIHSLSKKARKKYLRLAKAAINVANKSNVPRLQNIAKVLRTKIGNTTISTGEIDSLQREINNDLRSRRIIWGQNLNLRRSKTSQKSRRNSRRQEQKQRHSKQQPQQNSACDNGQPCVKFLRNL